MPDEISKKEYEYIKQHKDEKPYLTGFVGFGCSFVGKWFGGYAKDKSARNYCLNAKNSNLKILNGLIDVSFYNEDYREVELPMGSLIYCDIPYKNTTQYDKKEVGIFNHEEFYQWVRENSDKYEIYISEYKENVPIDFDIVWEMSSKKDIRDSSNKQVGTQEVLMKYKK